MSETRSYDETTIPPPMKSLKYDYDTKASLHSNSHSHHHDVSCFWYFHYRADNVVLLKFKSFIFQFSQEVAERDLGSTFLLPHTHLYKPERVSLYIKPIKNLKGSIFNFPNFCRVAIYPDLNLFDQHCILPVLTCQENVLRISKSSGIPTEFWPYFKCIYFVTLSNFI